MKDPWTADNPAQPPSLIRRTWEEVSTPMLIVVQLIVAFILFMANMFLCFFVSEFLTGGGKSAFWYAILFMVISVFVWWFGIAMYITHLKDKGIWDKIEW